MDMKKLQLLALLILIICAGCNDDSKKNSHKQKPYLDLANLWDIYGRDPQTVKNTINATFVSEVDTMDKSVGRVVHTHNYVKNTSCGPYTVLCYFNDSKLTHMYVSSFYKLPTVAFPHYLAISDELQEFTHSSTFPRESFYDASVSLGEYIDETESHITRFSKDDKDARSKYLKYANDCLKTHKPPLSHGYLFDFIEMVKVNPKNNISMSIGSESDKSIIVSLRADIYGGTLVHASIVRTSDVPPYYLELDPKYLKIYE